MMAFSSKELLSLLEYPEVKSYVVLFTHLFQQKFYNVFLFFDSGLGASSTDGAVLGSTGKTTYASGAYQSPLRHGCLKNFAATKSYIVLPVS